MSNENINYSPQDKGQDPSPQEQPAYVSPEESLQNLLKAIFSAVANTPPDIQMKQLITEPSLSQIEAEVIKGLQTPLSANLFGLQLPLHDFIGILAARAAQLQPIEPFATTIESRRNIFPLLQPYNQELQGRTIHAESATAEQIALLTDDGVDALINEAFSLIKEAFPNQDRISDRIAALQIQHFLKGSQRQVFTLRDILDKKLIMLGLFDQSNMSIPNTDITASLLSILYRAIRPDFQGLGLGGSFGTKVLTELQPDILTTTCTQTPSLRSWSNLAYESGIVENYEIYPHIEKTATETRIVPLPAQYRDLAIAAYRASPILHSQSSNIESGGVEANVAQFDEFMIRRSYYFQDLYDHTPWRENDQIARALNLKSRDAVFLVAIRRKIIDRIKK